MNGHRKLLAWQACRELAGKVYEVTAAFPADERFGLTAQVRRAAVSAAANVAEGFGRWGNRETVHYLSIALGSLAEVDTLLAIAQDLGYVDATRLAELDALRTRASQLVSALHRKMRSRIAS